MAAESMIPVPRIAAAFMLLILLTPWLASEGLGGLAAPTIALSLWIILAKHQLISEPWHIKDDQLVAWLDSELPTSGSGRRRP
jgi:hypothetical protein